jgi:natural product biosynthesis luciferase-like monooxygenase protein
MDTPTLPLTPTQQGMLFHAQLGLHRGVDIEQIVGTLDEALDTAAFVAAWQATIAGHDALRARFRWAGLDDPVQEVATQAELAWRQEDWRGLAPEAQRSRLATLLAADRERGIDLTAAPAMRLMLLRSGDASWRFVWTVHHIVCDGRSFALVLGEALGRYDAARAGRAFDAPPAPSFVAYARHVAAIDNAAAQAFWRERLAGFAAITPLPGTPQAASARGQVEQVLPAATAAALRALADAQGVSLATIVQGAWALLLERFGGGDDVVFGVTRSGRAGSVAGAASIVGCLINTLPMRVVIDGSAQVGPWLQRLHAGERAVRPFEQTPLLQVQGWSEVSAAGGGGRQLFDSLIVYDHASLDAQLGARGGAFTQRRFELVERTHYPLTLYAWNEPAFTLRLAYDRPRFDDALARRLVGGLARLLEGMATQPQAPLDALSALTREDEQALRHAWNDTARPQPGGCVHHAFEAQATRTPDAVALVFGDASISYDALNRRANRLALHLLGCGVVPDQAVALCLPRGIDLVVALLAIHKAGGAYLPLDPAYPRERLTTMLEDARAPLLVTVHRYASLVGSQDTRLVLLDADEPPWQHAPGGDPRSAARAGHLAYVIYTSGSTGRPKGTMVEHRQVMNFFAAMDERLPPPTAGGPGTWLAVTSLSFDISALELLWTLTRGWRVVLMPDAPVAPTAAPRAHAAQPIDLSLMYFSSAHAAGDDKYRLLLDGARFADANGFAAVWTPERHFHDFGGLYPNPAVTSAALAAVTKRIALRSGSVVAALHHPARIAEEWAVVDNLSGGRVGLSFAAGWQPRDFVLAPAALDGARAALRETVASVRRLWRGEAVEFDGAQGRRHEVRTWPRPLQRELPVWLTAAGSPQTFREAGEIGAGVLTHLLGQTHDELAGKIALYRQAWRDAGHSGPGHVTLMLHTFVGDDSEAVREAVRAPMTAYLKSSLGLVKGFAAAWTAFKKRADGTPAAVSDVDIDSLAPEELEGLLAFSFERYFESSGLFGDEARALDIIDRVKGLGVDEVACLIDFGVDEATVLAHLQHLARVREAAQPQRPAEHQDSIAQAIERHCVTHLQCTPSLAGALAQDPVSLAALARLDALLLGGEALPAALASTLARAGVRRLFNMYGPTETTIWSSMHEVGDETGTVPIGTPIANTRLHVLDAKGRLVPPGVAGELFIGGAGVVRGYLDRPELTAERFVPDPIDGAGRLYRSGDLVRRRDDGVLEFLGRVDHQVKIRGHRVELGEIEAALVAHPGVREAVVVAREDEPGALQLVAYVVGTDASSPPDAQALRAHLRRRLPEAMVPSHVVALAQWPQTPNRKIDRKALPPPAAALGEEGGVASVAVPPIEAAAAGDTERTIAAVWQAVLRLPQVGLDANFFDLGGHSLLAVKAHRQLVAALDAPALAITDLFRFPTVRALAAHLRSGRDTPVAAGSAAADRVALRREALAARRAARPQRPAA